MDSFLEALKNMGPGRLVMMLLTFFGLIIFFIFIAARSSAPSVTLLYGGLSVSDSTEIAAKLDAAKIAYRLSEDGTQVSVPQREVGKARMLLAQEGLPHQGTVGYEVFDKKQGFGATSFEQNISKLRALEGELARTISTISQVRSARVHLVLPQRELFSRETQPATASVFLNLRNSAGIGTEQIQAIQHLVAAAVPQLKASSIAIIDQNGDLLARGEEDSPTAMATGKGEDMRKQYEARISRSIEDIVGRIVGFGKVRANVTAQMNFDVVSKNLESYNPEGQVVRSTQTITDESSDASGSGGGTVSVENNLPGLPGGASGGAAGGSKSNRTEEVTNYEISKTIENIVTASGEVEKQSIAVLVDGRYETDTTVTKPEDAPEDWAAPKKYVPRTAEEIAQISALVKTAVGYDESRGDTVEVVNMPFAETDTFAELPDENMIMGFAKSDILGIAETLALSLVAVLIILLVLRPLATHFTSVARSSNSGGGQGGGDSMPLLSGQPMQAQLAAPGGGPLMPAGAGGQGELDSMIDMSSVEGKVKASSVQKVSELVTNYPNETVSVIRQWISQEN